MFSLRSASKQITDRCLFKISRSARKPILSGSVDAHCVQVLIIIMIIIIIIIIIIINLYVVILDYHYSRKAEA